MKFDPRSFLLSCSGVADSPNRFSVEAISDCGVDIYLPSEMDVHLPVFSRNRVFCCFTVNMDVPAWAASDDDIDLIFQLSLKEHTITEFLSLFREEECGSLRHRKYLQVTDCCVREFLEAPGMEELFPLFSDISVSNETKDGLLLDNDWATVHHRRRRPCRYPFDTVSMDLLGNVFQCPYCDNIITRFSDYRSLLSDSAILRFLASQLILQVDSLPQCSQCPFWLDGWIGDEEETLVTSRNQEFFLLWTGHSCRISREKRQ